MATKKSLSKKNAAGKQRPAVSTSTPTSRQLVIIPAYNEEETIREVVERSLAYADVSVTNDGSSDSTGEILEQIAAAARKRRGGHRLHIIHHPKSTHIPQGIQDGLRYAVEAGYDEVVTMDAGLSHDPDALPDFFAVESSIDVVIGMRAEIEGVPLYRRTISRMAAIVVNYALTDSWFSLRRPMLHDCTSGFRRYSRRVFTRIAESELKSKAFDFHMEALAISVRSGGSVREIPIRYIFSNSSFNRRVLAQATKFGLYLISTKGGDRA